MRKGKQFDEVMSFMSDVFGTKKTEVEHVPSIHTVKSGIIVRNAELVPSAARQAAHIIKQRFTDLINKIPTDLDTAVSIVTEKQAKKNMISYTAAAAFFLGAIVDSVAVVFLEEMNTQDFFTSVEWFGINTFLYGYGIGFGAPFWIGVDNPRQDCGGLDFVKLVQEFKIDLDNLETFTQNERFLFQEKIRFEKGLRLFCVTSKVNGHKQAALADSEMDEMIGLISLYFKLNNQAQNPGLEVTELTSKRIEELSRNIDELDNELKDIFGRFEKEIVASYDYVYSSIVSSNLIQFVIGALHVVGMVGGIFAVLDRTDTANFPANNISTTVLSNINELVEEGTFSNDLLVGDLLALFGQQCWGYGYYAPFFLTIQNPDPGCGIHDFYDIFRSYREFGDVRTFFGSPKQILSGAIILSVDNLPEYVKYRMEQFIRELKLGLHCLITRSDVTTYPLTHLLDSWLLLAKHRMDLTAELMNIV